MSAQRAVMVSPKGRLMHMAVWSWSLPGYVPLCENQGVNRIVMYAEVADLRWCLNCKAEVRRMTADIDRSAEGD